jgi:hypothetical protein
MKVRTMSQYRVYYLNVFQRSFPNRDAALDYIRSREEFSPEDFEILDVSDVF